VLRVVLPKNPVLRWLKIGTAQLNQVEYLSLHSIAAVSLNADLLMADVCMVARAGQGRAGQGRAGQGRAGQGRAGQGRAGQGRAACTSHTHHQRCRQHWLVRAKHIISASHVSRKANWCCIEAVRVVIVALQRVCVVAGQAAWPSWVGVHCHILLTCTDRHNRLGMLQGIQLSVSSMVFRTYV